MSASETSPISAAMSGSNGSPATAAASSTRREPGGSERTSSASIDMTDCGTPSVSVSTWRMSPCWTGWWMARRASWER